MIAAGGHELTGRDDRDAWHDAQLQALGLAGRREPALPRLGVGAHVLAQEHGGGADLLCDAHRLLHHVALPHDQRAAARAQRAIQVAQGLEHERHAIGCAEAAEHRVVEDEERHDPLGGSCGRRQGGLVAHAQVAREEDDGGAHLGARRVRAHERLRPGGQAEEIPVASRLAPDPPGELRGGGERVQHERQLPPRTLRPRYRRSGPRPRSSA